MMLRCCSAALKRYFHHCATCRHSAAARFVFFFFCFFPRLFSRKRFAMHKSSSPLRRRCLKKWAGWKTAACFRQRRLCAIAFVRYLKGEFQQRPSQGSLGGDSQHSRPAVACRLAELRRSCAGLRSRRRKSASSAPK